MYSDGDLEAAVSAGAITPEAAEALRSHIARARDTDVADEEHFRLITGFNDIFVSIAIALILIAVIWMGRATSPTLAAGAIVASSWGLAEFFTRKRRMALPSILLLLSYTLGSWAFAFGLIVDLFYHGNGVIPWQVQLLLEARWPAVMSAAVTTLMVYAHWRRFMVPITVAAGMAALLATVLPAIFIIFPGLLPYGTELMLLSGLCVFGVAMRWDMSDIARRTRRSDVAFWLHLMAAPLLVHPAFALLGLLGGAGIGLGHAIAVIVIYVALGLVALAIDRRALLVSALAYVLTAMSALFKAAGSAGFSFALTALIIGSLLLVLSAFWHIARRPVMALLPEGLRVRLPAV
jgi:hypothetical protein